MASGISSSTPLPRLEDLKPFAENLISSANAAPTEDGQCFVPRRGEERAAPLVRFAFPRHHVRVGFELLDKIGVVAAGVEIRRR